MSYFNPQAGETHADVLRKKKIAEKLFAGAGGTPQSLGEGLTVLGRAIAGRIAMNEAMKMEQAGISSARSGALDAIRRAAGDDSVSSSPSNIDPTITGSVKEEGFSSKSPGGGLPSKKEIASYVRQSARVRNIDENVALRMARSEGMNAKPEEAWQSFVKTKRGREPSYGVFQLLVGGKGTGFSEGLGNAMIRETGIDPRDPTNWREGIDFALNKAAEGGWGPWYGRLHAGIGKRDGLRGARAVPISKRAAAAAANVANFFNPVSSAQASPADPSRMQERFFTPPSPTPRPQDARGAAMMRASSGDEGPRPLPNGSPRFGTTPQGPQIQPSPTPQAGPPGFPPQGGSIPPPPPQYIPNPHSNFDQRTGLPNRQVMPPLDYPHPGGPIMTPGTSAQSAPAPLGPMQDLPRPMPARPITPTPTSAQVSQRPVHHGPPGFPPQEGSLPIPPWERRQQERVGDMSRHGQFPPAPGAQGSASPMVSAFPRRPARPAVTAPGALDVNDAPLPGVPGAGGMPIGSPRMRGAGAPIGGGRMNPFGMFGSRSGDVPGHAGGAFPAAASVRGAQSSVGGLDMEVFDLLGNKYLQPGHRMVLEKIANQQIKSVFGSKARPMMPEERAKWGIPDTDETPYYIDEDGVPRKLGGSGVTVNVGSKAKGLGTEDTKQLYKIYEGISAKEGFYRQLEDFKRISSNVETGRITPITKEFTALVEGVTGVRLNEQLPLWQAFEAQQNLLALKLRNPDSGFGLTGNTSDRDVKFLLATVANLSNTPEANQLILTLLAARTRREIALEYAKAEHIENNGSIVGWRAAAKEFMENNPLLTPEEEAFVRDVFQRTVGHEAPSQPSPDPRKISEREWGLLTPAERQKILEIYGGGNANQ